MLSGECVCAERRKLDLLQPMNRWWKENLEDICCLSVKCHNKAAAQSWTMFTPSVILIIQPCVIPTLLWWNTVIQAHCLDACLTWGTLAPNTPFVPDWNAKCSCYRWLTQPHPVRATCFFFLLRRSCRSVIKRRPSGLNGTRYTGFVICLFAFDFFCNIRRYLPFNSSCVLFSLLPFGDSLYTLDIKLAV